MGQPVAFFEVISQDAPRAQKFYADLFGWQVAADPAMGGYALVDTGAGENAIGGGIGPATDPGEAGVKIYMRRQEAHAAHRPARRLRPVRDLRGSGRQPGRAVGLTNGPAEIQADGSADER